MLGKGKRSARKGPPDDPKLKGGKERREKINSFLFFFFFSLCPFIF